MKKLLMMVMLSVVAPGCSRGPGDAAKEHQAPPRERPAIDPRSSEAAVDLVQRFAALLNQRKFDEGYMLLGPGAPSRKAFDTRFSAYSDLRVSTGSPGAQEGAAGSVYLAVPMTVTGRLGGKRSSLEAKAVVRRVNDVPGSSEAQRHWHIERIDWGEGR